VSYYGSLVRNVFFPLTLLRRGDLAQLRYLREFERTQYISADELRNLQTTRLRALLFHAQASCSYYRRRFAEAGIAPDDIRSLEELRFLPALEKGEIQKQFADMIARDWSTSDLIRNQTGGSTGTPITFYLCRDRKCSRAAATLRHNRWAGWEIGDRAAVIWGAPRDAPGNTLRARLRGALLREPLWLDAGALTEETLGAFHKALWHYRPRIILAYARSAVLFAQYLQARRLEAYRPRSLLTSAEVLEVEDRKLLERAFCCPVFNRYGCREVSVIASECPAHRGMHVMAEGLYVEIETPDGPAGPGQMGSILVTDLLNPAMPLIRYRIGDMGSWASGNCPCGRHLPRLSRVAGRVTDFLVGCSGQMVSGVFLATYVVAQRPSLGQVQIHQHRAGHLTWKVRPGSGFDLTSDREYLCRATREYLGVQATADVEPVRDFPPTPSGKFLFSQSSVLAVRGGTANGGDWASGPDGRAVATVG
jgi:phenylacetate-CoA ligase